MRAAGIADNGDSHTIRVDREGHVRLATEDIQDIVKLVTMSILSHITLPPVEVQHELKYREHKVHFPKK